MFFIHSPVTGAAIDNTCGVKKCMTIVDSGPSRAATFNDCVVCTKPLGDL